VKKRVALSVVSRAERWVKKPVALSVVWKADEKAEMLVRPLVDLSAVSLAGRRAETWVQSGSPLERMMAH
jgi:hypothetical protein